MVPKTDQNDHFCVEKEAEFFCVTAIKVPGPRQKKRERLPARQALSFFLCSCSRLCALALRGCFACALRRAECSEAVHPVWIVHMTGTSDPSLLLPVIRVFQILYVPE